MQRSPLSLLALVLALLSAPTPSRADDSKTERIERLLRSGTALAKRNKYTGAIIAFREALALSAFPDSSLFLNLGKLYDEGQKDCGAALLYYQGYLLNETQGEFAGDVEARVKRCRAAVVSSLGRLSVLAKAEGLPIRINDVPIGSTPIADFELATGSYTVVCESDDYHPVTVTSTVEVGLETRVDLVLKKRIFKGILTVEVDPPDASIWVDEEMVASKSPFTRKDATTRTYLVRVERDGWDRWVRYVTVERDSETKVEVVLEQTGEQVPVPPLPKNED